MSFTYLLSKSGGVGSWASGRKLIDEHGIPPERIRLLFTDTLIEDGDLYRFLIEAAHDLHPDPDRDIAGMLEQARALPEPTKENMPRRKRLLGTLREEANGAFPELEWVAEGRTPFEVFSDRRFLGNTMKDPCSKVLKRDLMRAWVRDRYRPEEVAVVVGIDWQEAQRMRAIHAGWAPYRVVAPMMQRPLWAKPQAFSLLAERGIDVPYLYKLGFPHNNCGGGCVKAGMQPWAHLRQVLPDRYDDWALQEEEIREELGDVSILRDRSGGVTRPLPLVKFAEQIDSGERTVKSLETDLGCGGGCALSFEEHEIELPEGWEEPTVWSFSRHRYLDGDRRPIKVIPPRVDPVDGEQGRLL